MGGYPNPSQTAYFCPHMEGVLTPFHSAGRIIYPGMDQWTLPVFYNTGAISYPCPLNEKDYGFTRHILRHHNLLFYGLLFVPLHILH